jgi:hypothetical protein
MVRLSLDPRLILPGMAAGAPRRNALVALGYLVIGYLLTRTLLGPIAAG